jgi:tape measure domain-containing protein
MSNDKTLELQIRIAAQEAFQSISSLKGEISSLAAEAKKLSDSDGQAIADTFRQTQAAAEKAAASMKLFGSSSTELRQVQAQLKSAAVELVTNGLDPQSEEVKKLVEEYKRLGKEAADLDKANGNNVQSFGDLKSAMMRLAEVVALTKALSVVKDMGDFALQTADNFQTARNQFGTLLGDMEAGAGLFNEIKAFNDKTPFDLDTLTQTTNVLIAAKVPLQDLQAQLTKFGDLSQGNSQKLTSYVNAFSQAAAKGKADMQVLNTYLHQGVPILDALAKNFGVTTAEIVEMSSQGKISFEDFSRALDDLTSAGGQYFGGMELASKSLAAMQEGLKESVNTLAASFGEMLLPSAVSVAGILTDITNMINESPIAKGILAGAIIAVTGYMAAMAAKAVVLAAKTWLAQAAQMGLNASLAVTNPLLIAGIAAAAAATVAYVAYAAKQQQATRAAGDLALAQRRSNDAMREGANAVHEFYRASQGFDFSAALHHIQRLRSEIDEIRQRSIPGVVEVFVPRSLIDDLKSATDRFIELRDEFIKEFYDSSTDDKIKTLRDRINVAQTYMVTVGISGEDRNALEKIIANAREEIDKLLGDINEKADKWKEDWAGVWNKFQADQANDPFYDIELERKKKLKEAWDNYVRDGDKEIIKQVNDYYDAQRGEVIRQLAEEEARIQRELTKSKIDDLQYEFDETIKAINTLEAQRIIAAAGSEEEIARIRKEYEDMRKATELQFEVEINTAKLEEARDAVKDWQEELSDSFALALMDIEGFSEQASVLIGDMAAQLAAVSFEGILDGLNAVGRAFATGGDAAENLQQAIADAARQILQQLPMMFLQAGLQLIASGQWAMGLGFIAAAGSSAIISGYVDGASKHAQGGVFDEYGKAARTFAAGGAFTNQIVSTPTYFQYGGGFGLMGEAGPEAIMPLTRMPNGNLGVQTANGGGTQVIVNVINNSGTEVHQEEKENADGSRQIDVYIGEMVNKHIASGKADRAMGRYGLRAAGV